MIAAAFLDVFGWGQPTLVEQVSALAGGGLGLAAWLLAWALFGSRRRR
jgi:hypothetical protein